MNDLSASAILKRRKALGMTRETLGNLLGVSVKTLYNYENGGTIPPKSKAVILQRVLYPEKEPKPLNLSIGESIDARFKDLQAQIDELKRELKKPGT